MMTWREYKEVNILNIFYVFLYKFVLFERMFLFIYVFNLVIDENKEYFVI